MANLKNVTFIVTKLLEQLKNTSDRYFRKELVVWIIQIIEKKSPSNEWLLDTIVNLLSISGDLLDSGEHNQFIAMIKKGQTL